jgi:hypothetical protein
MDVVTLKALEAEIAAVTPEENTHRAPLTVRTIPEILEMKFDADDLILENGYATKGDLTAICGMGGVGKSRLAIQFAFCCRAGRDFLGWKTRGHDLRSLFLQTENSCRRLNSDIAKMLGGFTPEEQEAIKSGIFFHTLEQDDDGFLALDTENKQRVEDKITQTAADVVVWDPLRDFSVDDLNSDKFMGETLRDILRLTKRGNPKRFPLAIHHAATGRAGVQKTTGWDRSSFGRNSKVLQMIARAVINVAPGKGEDNSTIVIGSGKSNNAPEFSLFAATLNFETMLYARDEDFDVERWKKEIATGKEARVTPKDFRELLNRGVEYEKKQLVKILNEEKGVAKTYAYRIIDEAKSRQILRLNKVTKTYALR